MSEQRNSFLEQVKAQIKSKEAQAFVSAELHHHLNEVKAIGCKRDKRRPSRSQGCYSNGKSHQHWSKS